MTTQDNTDALLASRRTVYGDRKSNMERTAQIWSGLLGFTVRPEMVPIMMAAYKALRFEGAPDYSDNIDDIEGWVRMARELVSDRLIQARTVEEYLKIKEKKDAPRNQEAEDMTNWYRRKAGKTSLEKFLAHFYRTLSPEAERTPGALDVLVSKAWWEWLDYSVERPDKYPTKTLLWKFLRKLYKAERPHFGDEAIDLAVDQLFQGVWLEVDWRKVDE